MQTKKLATILLVVAFMVTGCAMFQPQLPQTPRDKADVFMSFYMAQLLDYNRRYAIAEQSDVVSAMEINILNAKYEFLQVAWEPIALYDSFADAGTIPPAKLEMEIMALMDILENALREGRE